MRSRANLQSCLGLRHGCQRRQRSSSIPTTPSTLVSARAFPWRGIPSSDNGIMGHVRRTRQDRCPCRLQPDLRPSEWRGPRSRSAARYRSGTAGFLHWRQQHAVTAVRGHRHSQLRTTAFRIGTDGNTAPLPAVTPTLPQPYYPGVNGNAAAGAGEVLDPNFRPSQSDEIDLTIQREMPGKGILEVGYIFRRIRNEYQPLDLVGVPYMLTEGGQQFQNAWANMYQQLAGGTPTNAVTAQPFFESALGGTSSAFCSGYSAHVLPPWQRKESNLILSNAQVYDMWQTLSPSFTFGRSMASSPNCADGRGSNHQLVARANLQPDDRHRRQRVARLWQLQRCFRFLQHCRLAWADGPLNFTYSRSLGTQGVVQASSEFTDPNLWNIGNSYGPQPFDLKYVYNLAMLYQPPFYKGEHGIDGPHPWRLVVCSDLHRSQRFPGRNIAKPTATVIANSPSERRIAARSRLTENAIFVSSAAIATARGAGNSVQNVGAVAGVVGSSGNPANGGAGLNLFANPTAVYNSVPHANPRTGQRHSGKRRGRRTPWVCPPGTWTCNWSRTSISTSGSGCSCFSRV